MLDEHKHERGQDTIQNQSEPFNIDKWRNKAKAWLKIS